MLGLYILYKKKNKKIINYIVEQSHASFILYILNLLDSNKGISILFEDKNLIL